MKKQVVLSMFTGVAIFLAVSTSQTNSKQQPPSGSFEKTKSELKKQNADLKAQVKVKDTAIIKDLSTVKNQVDRQTVVRYRWKKIHDTVFVSKIDTTCNCPKIDTVYIKNKTLFQRWFPKIFKYKKPGS